MEDLWSVWWVGALRRLRTVAAEVRQTVREGELISARLVSELRAFDAASSPFNVLPSSPPSPPSASAPSPKPELPAAREPPADPAPAWSPPARTPGRRGQLQPKTSRAVGAEGKARSLANGGTLAPPHPSQALGASVAALLDARGGAERPESPPPRLW